MKEIKLETLEGVSGGMRSRGSIRREIAELNQQILQITQSNDAFSLGPGGGGQRRTRERNRITREQIDPIRERINELRASRRSAGRSPFVTRFLRSRGLL